MAMRLLWVLIHPVKPCQLACTQQRNLRLLLVLRVRDLQQSLGPDWPGIHIRLGVAALSTIRLILIRLGRLAVTGIIR